MTDILGLKTLGPDGAIWIDTSSIITRVVEVLSFSNNAPLSGDTANGDGSYRHTFACIDGKIPWFYAVKITGNAFLGGVVTKASGNLAHFDYTLDGSWTSGAVLVMVGETGQL